MLGASKISIAWILLFAVLWPLESRCESFTARGDVVYRSYVYDMPVEMIQTRFEVYVDGPRWLIDVSSIGPRGKAELSYRAAFDGTNLFTIDFLFTNKDMDFPASEGAWDIDTSAFSSICHVTTGGVPRGRPGINATFLWFVFIPAVLSDATASQKAVRVWDDPLMSDYTGKIPISIRALNGATSVVAWMDNRALSYTKPSGRHMRQGPVQLAGALYPIGTTNAVMTIVHTNYSGYRVPVTVKLIYYMSHPDDSTGDAPQKTVAELELRFFEPRCLISQFRPLMPPMTIISDERIPVLFRRLSVESNGGPWSLPPLERLASQHNAHYDGRSTGRNVITPHLRRATRQILAVLVVFAGSAFVLLKALANGRSAGSKQ
jgi:hypothetical protein